MELGGTWRAAVADEALRRAYTHPSFDDTGWEPVTVPHHWRSVPAFSDTDGPLLYRRAFDYPRPDASRRVWLALEGLFYQGDVWFDGAYLGDTEGYFVPHAFEITELLRAADDHTVAVEVACHPQRDRTRKRNLTGVFQHWDCLDPEWNPGGIWRPVRLEETGPVRICDLVVTCRETSRDRAVLAFTALLDSTETRPVTVRTAISPAHPARSARLPSVGAVDHELARPLAAGENRVTWAVTVPDPPLWWPWSLGEPHLVDVEVSVSLGGAPSDTRRLRTGLRQIRMHNWIASVNGERLFLKGSNVGPARMALAEASPEELRHDVHLAVDCGLDLLRVHAHVSRPELYDAADEAGLLLWQDLPLQWGYARGVRKQAVRQARSAVSLLGHHPSVAIWCGHNEPMAIDIEPGELAARALARTAARALAAQELPSWNKTILDRSIKRSLERADGTRPVIAHSGVLPHPPTLDGTDSHLYFGWYWGDERNFPRFLATWPRLARFVSEFGAQAVPEDAAFCEPARWPDLDWERLGRRHALQKRFFDRLVPPAEYDSFDAWRRATQHYQATVVKHHVETLRRLKYRPCGGFAHFLFTDAMPAVSWSVLGHDRQPKAAFHALADACEPVIVVADRLPPAVRGGDALALDVHVVSDRRDELEGAIVTSTLTWPNGSHIWRWRGDIGPDSCVRVGTIQFEVPATVEGGELVLILDLDGPVKATNAYEALLVANER